MPSDCPIIFDGGLRSGEDIVKALASGASFTMLGRPFLFASSAAGPAGPDRFAATLVEEIGVTLAQIGLTSTGALDARVISRPERVRPTR